MTHQEIAQVRKPAPRFTAKAVVDGVFETVSLDSYIQDPEIKYILLFFYPMDFTFVCPTEACVVAIIAFSERIEQFKALKTAVLACSCDSEYSHLAWVNTPKKEGGLGPMKIPLIADKTHEIAKKYGVYLEESGFSLRGLFIIGGDGIVRQITINDTQVGRSTDEALRLIEAFQFSDEFGEVCPVNWKKGASTIKPEVTESKEYFGKQK
ncbi:3458_t:CDS:2 [Paraglomus brasilianum]|uniref:thioredoxin-dependent peroxiredoxin n=1 Tax=Paraglomus brasilianum TaxID=144538 RepID=A0A9N8ZCL4_9GLOM|nr:3458_t:CDS:2 [Paraglomus brasilianum]